ncbi:density-regulated protein homolog [Mytilus galloprovincialis]|uniref:density-regulated protein homolog n=1 Tax=Mytilus galloprovincialis TaxID=29158 RepID=UPI003F7BC75C
MAAADTETCGNSKFLPLACPQPGVTYPIQISYCGECTMPLEYCEYYPNYEKCKKWLEKNLPEEFERLMSIKDEEEGGEGDAEKKRQKRGGKGQMKAKKKTEPQGVRIGTAKRGKKKMVTIVMGLATYDIDLKDASKAFSKKFSCGSSIQGEDEIEIQGDVKDDLFDFLPEKWPQIDEDSIDDVGDLKK